MAFWYEVTREIEVTAYTWTIDGLDLAEWVGRHRQERDPAIPAEETVWLAGSTEDAQDRIARLLVRSPPEFGRRSALLMCPECGDIGCGAFTAEIVINGDSVEWRAIGYDGGATNDPPLLFEPSLNLTFDREQYVGTLRTALKQLGPPAL